MSDAPVRVSVIIPVYNSMPYLAGALESLAGQTLREIEVIAIDDGSTDGSGEELDRIADTDARFTVIHQPNSGWPGMPRNRGIERARGDYLFFMDGDDEMARDALEQMVSSADGTGADVVVPRFAGTGGRGIQTLFQLHPAGPMSISRAMETLSPQKLFRRSLVEQYGIRFPEGHVRLEDGIFVTECYLRASSIEMCGKAPLYFIAKRDDSQNISSQPIDPDGYVDSCRNIAQLLADGAADQALATKLIREFFLRKGLRFYAPKRWNTMDQQRKARWVSLHRSFLHEFLPVDSDARVSYPSDRNKLRLIRAEDVAGLDRAIAAVPALRQESECARMIEHPFGLEVRVRVRAGEGASLLDGAPAPGALRLRIANKAMRLGNRLLSQRGGRAALQRFSRLAAGSAVTGTMLLSGRKTSGQTEIAGVLCGWDEATGSRTYRFLVPWHLLTRFGRDRIDLWTVVAIGDLYGARTRLSGGTARKRSFSRVKAYVTAQGNLSLRPMR